MTAQIFTPNFPRRDKDELDGSNFISRVKTVEGTARPSGTTRTAASPEFGSVHKNSVQGYQHPDLNHRPHSSVHRPEIDEGQLKANQTAMISTRQRRKNKQSKSK